MDELVAKHGGIHFPEDKKDAFARVAAVLLWGELAAWSISAARAVIPCGARRGPAARPDARAEWR